MKQFVNRYLTLFTFMFAFLLVGAIAYAQAVVLPADPVTNEQFFTKAFAFFGTIKGASVTASILAVLQLIYLFCYTPLFANVFKKVTSENKFKIIQALTIAIGFVTLLTTGSTIGAAVLQTLMIKTVQEGVFSLIQKYILKKKP